MQFEVKPVSKATADILSSYREELGYYSELEDGDMSASIRKSTPPWKDYSIELHTEGGRFGTAELMCGYYSVENGDVCWENQWVFIPDGDEWYLITHQTDVPYISTFYACFVEVVDDTMTLAEIPEGYDSYEYMQAMAEESVVQAFNRNSVEAA